MVFTCFFSVIPSEALAKSRNPISRNEQPYKANTYNIIWSAYALKDETRSTPFHSAQGDTLFFNIQPIRRERSTSCQRGQPRLAGADLPAQGDTLIKCHSIWMMFKTIQNLFKTLKYIQYCSISVQNHTKNSKHKSKFIKPALLI